MTKQGGRPSQLQWQMCVLVSTLVLLSPLATLAAAQPQQDPPKSPVIHHPPLWFGDGPYGKEMQLYRIQHGTSGNTNVSAIGWTEQRGGAEVQVSVVVANTSSTAYEVFFEVFENGERIRTEAFNRPLFEMETGRKLNNKHAEQLLGLWADLNGVADLVRVLQTELEPCMKIGTECRRKVAVYFPNLRDVYHYIPIKPLGGRKAIDILAATVHEWEKRGKAVGQITPGVMAVVGYPPALSTAEVVASDLSHGPATCPATACTPGTQELVTPAPAVGAATEAPGGVDFSTLELRYIADSGPGLGQGVRYAFSGEAAPSYQNADEGRTAVLQTSDSFFVWLQLTPDRFWVNLNPNEPDRIIDPGFGTTDAGRILLQADLLMKKTVAGLIHPDTTLGAQFWDSLDAGVDQEVCLSFRQWIVPGRATVHEDADGVYIVDAPLSVQLEGEYLERHGVASSATSCSLVEQAEQQRNEEVFRSLVLPKVQQAVNSAPEYAELRRVYLSRVAAEWYRRRSSLQPTRYSELINQGDVSSWPARQAWSPDAVFDEYVDSYTKGEFHVTHEREEGTYIVAETYIYGGVDFSHVPLKPLQPAVFQQRHPGLATVVDASVTRPAADHQGRVWLGGFAGAPPPEAMPAGSTPSGPQAFGARSGWLLLMGGGALLLVLIFVRRHSFRLSREWPHFGESLIWLRCIALALLLAIPVVYAIRIDSGERSKQTLGTEGKIPTPAMAPAPVVSPHRISRTEQPDPGFTTGTCLTGTIPEQSGPVSADDVAEVPCDSPNAHYKVIQTFPGTSDMNMCQLNRDTQYAYSRRLTRNGVPVLQFVYCLVGIGPFAR